MLNPAFEQGLLSIFSHILLYFTFDVIAEAADTTNVSSRQVHTASMTLNHGRIIRPTRHRLRDHGPESLCGL